MWVKKQQLEQLQNKWLVQDWEISMTGLSAVPLFNLYARHIMRNTGLNALQIGIDYREKQQNNLRYVDDTSLMAESKEELKSLLMKVKEESEKAGLKFSIQ